MSGAYIGISALIMLILSYNYIFKRFNYDAYKRQIDKTYADGFFLPGGYFNLAPIPIDDKTEDDKLQKLKFDFNRSVKHFWITFLGLFVVYLILISLFDK